MGDKRKPLKKKKDDIKPSASVVSALTPPAASAAQAPRPKKG